MVDYMRLILFRTSAVAKNVHRDHKNENQSKERGPDQSPASRGYTDDQHRRSAASLINQLARTRHQRRRHVVTPPLFITTTAATVLTMQLL